MLEEIRATLDELTGLVEEEEAFWDSPSRVPESAKAAVDMWLLSGAEVMLSPILFPAIEDMLIRDCLPQITDETAEDVVDGWLLRTLRHEHGELQHPEGSPEAGAALVVRMVAHYVHSHASDDHESGITAAMDEKTAFERAMERVGSEAWSHVADRVSLWRFALKDREAEK